MTTKGFKRGPLPVDESFKGESTMYVLNTYDGAMRVYELAKLQQDAEKEKKFLRDAKIIRGYLIRDRLNNLSAEELKELYENRVPEEDYSEKLLLEFFTKKATERDDLLWAYNTNVWENVEVILERKIKKMFKSFESWEEILEDEPVGSKVCKLIVENMIPKIRTLGQLLETLKLNKQNITQTEVKRANKAAMLEIASTIRITKEEKKIYGDEFEIKDDKVILKNWK